jgi:hypothetical protein
MQMITIRNNEVKNIQDRTMSLTMRRAIIVEAQFLDLVAARAAGGAGNSANRECRSAIVEAISVSSQASV